VFANTPTLVAPILGTPTSGNFSSGSFTWPTFNQNTTGTAAGLSATLAIASGGTGQTTANAAFNALAPSQTSASGKYLKSDGTNTSWDALDISTADITGTLPVANGGTGVTSSTGTGNVVLSNSPTLVTPILGTPQSGNFSTGTFTWPTFNQNTTGTAAGLSATLATTSGGTGLTSFTSGGVVYASSSSALATGSALNFDGTNLTAVGSLVAQRTGGVSQYARISNTGGTATFISDNQASSAYTGFVFQGLSTASGTPVDYLNLTSSSLYTASGINVGFGTSSPNGRLEVVGSTGASFNGWFRTGDATAANNAGGGFYNTSSATATSRSAIMVLDADGANISGGDYFFIQKNGNSGTVDLLQYSNAAMRFGTNYTNRATYDMTLDSSGNLGIGTSSPVSKLDVAETVTIKRITSGNTMDLNFYNGSGVGTAGNVARVRADGDGVSNDYGALVFFTGQINSSPITEQVRIDSVGNVKLQKNISVGGATPTTSGTGITFPATQSASSDANTLDDYEEGTWTPVLGGDGGGTAMTYSTQIGKYTKIGNVVTADAYVLLSARGTITGNVVITGLPFTGNANYNSSVTWGYWNSLGTNWASVGGWLNNGNTIYLGGQQTSNTIIQTMAQADITNISRINVQVIYTLG
jgi:hypothetical protein